MQIAMLFVHLMGELVGVVMGGVEIFFQLEPMPD
jgi:hypothetical protein